MKKLLVLGFVGVLTGCAAPMWNHSTNSEFDFNRDKAVCSMEADRANPSAAIPFDPRMDPMQRASTNMHNAGANMGRAFGVQGFFNNCMLSKGYYQVKK
jgi:hypothetical protein